MGKDSVVMVRCLVMKLSEKNHTYFLQKLSKQRAKLVKGASDTIANDLSVIDGELADTIDRSTVETERSFMLRLRERERKLINKKSGNKFEFELLLVSPAFERIVLPFNERLLPSTVINAIRIEPEINISVKIYSK